MFRNRWAAIALTGFLSVLSAPVYAQATAPNAQVAPTTVSQTRLRDITARLSKSSGLLVVADRSLESQMVDFETKGGPLESVLSQLAARLPEGTVVRQALLPPLRAGAPTPDGERILALLVAQDALAEAISGPAKPAATDVNVLGKILPADEARRSLAPLDARPVYLLTNPRLRDNPVFQANKMQEEMLRRFMSMTPEQQSAMFDQQWDNMMNMDPALRKAMLQQAVQASMSMMQKMQKLTPDQRNQFMNDIRQALPPGFGQPGGPGSGG